MEKIRNISENKTDCSGCSACSSICPKDAITMKPDTLGFMYPEVDNEKCIDCNLCEKVCSFNSPTPSPLQIVFLMRLKNVDELMKSRSGGAFYIIAMHIIDMGGVIYGAAFNEDFSVSHLRVDDFQDLDKLRGTKYVQSDLNDTFLRCRSDLKNGKTVLFTGTPCQISGLKTFIGNKLSENLYTIDMLCHGVPSPYIWRDYLKENEFINREKIKAVSFRDKRYGWKACRNTITFNDGSFKFSRLFSDYIYHKWICLRMSCKDCPFATRARIGDITIGDGWTCDSIAPAFNQDDKGVSFVMVNTYKGDQLLNKIKDHVNLVETTLNKCMQDPLCQSVPFHKDRENFERDYGRFGYWYVRVRYLPYVFHFINKCFKKILKKF